MPYRNKRHGERHKRKRDRLHAQHSGISQTLQAQQLDEVKVEPGNDNVASPSKRIEQENDDMPVAQVCLFSNVLPACILLYCKCCMHSVYDAVQLWLRCQLTGAAVYNAVLLCMRMQRYTVLSHV